MFLYVLYEYLTIFYYSFFLRLVLSFTNKLLNINNSKAKYFIKGVMILITDQTLVCTAVCIVKTDVAEIRAPATVV